MVCMHLRIFQNKSDTFAKFKQKLLHVAPGYPNASGLVASMGNRVAMCIAKNGAAIKK